MTNKLEISRGQFESANPVPFGVFWSDPDSRYMTTMVHLNCLEYNGKWLGWQSALLAAPVVEHQEPVESPISELEILRSTCKQLEAFRDKVVSGWLTTRPACFAMKSMLERIQAKKGTTHAVYGFPEDGYDVPLYAEPPAPVAVVLPDLGGIREYHYDASIRLDRYADDADMRKSDSEHYRKRALFHRDQVATIDKVKELNQ